MYSKSCIFNAIYFGAHDHVCADLGCVRVSVTSVRKNKAAPVMIKCFLCSWIAWIVCNIHSTNYASSHLKSDSAGPMILTSSVKIKPHSSVVCTNLNAKRSDLVLHADTDRHGVH